MRIEKKYFFLVADFFSRRSASFKILLALLKHENPSKSAPALYTVGDCAGIDWVVVGISGITCEDLSRYVVIRNIASNGLQ